MVTIRFMQDRVVQDEHQGTPHETRFSAGQVVDLAEASAAHWLSRGAAERVLPADEPPAPPPAPSASWAETQPSLDLTGAPVGNEDGPAADASAGDDDNGSSDEAAPDAAESAEEAGTPASESQPGLDLAGESGAGDGGSPDNAQAGAPGEKPGKSERRPARASAKTGSKA
jgi:hypothetical protein